MSDAVWVVWKCVPGILLGGTNDTITIEGVYRDQRDADRFVTVPFCHVTRAELHDIPSSSTVDTNTSR